MFEFLVRDYAILISLVVVVGAIARLFPDAVAQIRRSEHRVTQLTSRAAAGLFALTLVWITVFDDWRRLLGVPTGWLQDQDSQIASDPFYVTPPSDAVRTITWILIIASVLGGAYLYSRISGSISLPLLLFPLSLVTFFIVNTFRLRFDVDSVKIAYGTIDSPLEVVTTLFWVAGIMLTLTILILCFYFMIWSPVTLVFGIIYRRTWGRPEVVEAPIFDKLKERRNRAFQEADGQSRP